MKYYALIITLLILACNKSKEEEQLLDKPLTEKELLSIPEPTFQQFINAYEYVTQKDPTIISDNVRLSRAVFNRIKTNPNGRVRNPEDVNTDFFGLLNKLNNEELKLIFLKLNVYDAYVAMSTVEPSKATASTSFPCDSNVGFEDSKADAFRHAYWSALMVLRTNLQFAEDFGTAHEAGSTKPAATVMDLHNNKFGRDLAVKYPNATEKQLIDLLIQQKYFYLKEGDPIPKNLDGLVFFAGKNKFDVTLTGSITNPDSGGPWSIVLDIAQCGSDLRGQFNITRGSELQKRRYVGKLNSDNSITLNVSEPYIFENPNGLVPCMNMVLSLTGNETSLKGSWKSSNCLLGGVINIGK